MFKKLLSHTAIYGMAPHISKVASVFTLPIITKYLTDIDYGVYGTIMAYQTAITVFGSIGLRVVLVNSFFKSPSQYKWLWRQVYGFLIYWSFFFALVTTCLLYFILPEAAIENRWSIILLSVLPSLVFGPINLIGFNYYQLSQKPLQVAYRTVASGLITVFLNLYFIAELQMGYMGWIWSTFIVRIIINSTYWYPMFIINKFKPILNFKRKTIKRALKVSLPLVPHYYSSYLLDSSDKVVMDNMGVAIGDIGKYNISYSVARMISSLGNAIGLAIGPILKGFYKSGDYVKARDLVIVTQIALLLLTSILALWMKEIFGLLIKNQELANMYYLGIILVMSYAYRPMYLGASIRLMFAEKTTLMPKLTFSAGLLNVGLNLILIPIFGFEVAVITTFLGYMLMGYGFYTLKSLRKLLEVNYYPFVMLLATCIITIGVYYAKDISVISKSLLTTLGGLGILYYYRKSMFLKNAG
ncbi:lipopolysaccharide biosynthesis protein [Roseivirga pacifica]|uniref:lipopolysaccharide biosynthesis protein n=1 Tax=Roseivirga pacifica TaxID=1267423 RepID=UPI00227AE154|nr:lipopolysaccharide biosynthesis protein [Roseivirga pacifica]